MLLQIGKTTPQCPKRLPGDEYTVPKTKQISERIGEEVLWRENVPIIRGNYA
jgi:hypothetical protein